MAPTASLFCSELLTEVRIARIARCKHTAWLYSNPLGAACYQLDREEVVGQLEALRHAGLLDAGIAFTSTVTTPLEDRPLSQRELRLFQAEVGCSPLQLACVACGNHLEALVKDTSLSSEARKEQEREIQGWALDVVRVLAENGACVSMPDVGPLGHTPLHVAARSGATSLVSALLRVNADIEARDNEGISAQSLAERSGHLFCVQVLEVAARVVMDARLPMAEALADGEEREKLRKQRELERRRQKRAKLRAEARASATQAQCARAQLPQRAVQKEPGGAKPQGGDSEPSDPADKTPSAVATYSGKWMKLDEELFPDDASDADLPDEWDPSKWGDYEDWGEDWDQMGYAEALPEDSGDDLADEEDDDVRAEVARLRQEKAATLQRLHQLAEERQSRADHAEAAELQASRFEERAKRLEERQARIKAGDPDAADDTVAEEEVSAWWEERAVHHARRAWELEQALEQQRHRQSHEVATLGASLAEADARSQELVETWNDATSARLTFERQELKSSRKRLVELAQELCRLGDELEADLPPLVAGNPEDGLGALPSLTQLLGAAEVHRSIQVPLREDRSNLKEYVTMCNKRVADKDDAVAAEVTQELLAMGASEDTEAWYDFAELAVRAGRLLSEAEKRREVRAARRSPPGPPAGAPGTRRKRNAASGSSDHS